MGLKTRIAASAAVALVGLPTANAGFVYQSALRSVDIAVSGSSVDSDSSTAFGSWFGSASMLGSGYSSLASHGSNLSYGELILVGAAQVSAPNSVANIVARSWADVTFLADMDETISWIAGLGVESTGVGNIASVSVIVTDVGTGAIRFASSDDSTGSGSFAIVAGHNYRVQITASSTAATSGEVLSNFNVGFYSIPAPGALALVGLAGLVVFARRSR